MADQTSEPLEQRQDRQRHLVVVEGLAATRGDIASMRAAVIGSPGEANGSLSMITQLNCSPDDVDALPERGGRKQHGVRRRPELTRAARFAALCLAPASGYGSVASDHFVDRVHRRVTGEQHEGAAACAAAGSR